MKILILKGGFGHVYEPAWANALIAQGHDVMLFDSHSYTSKGTLGKIERKYFIGIGLTKIRKKALDVASKFKPEIILIYQGHYYDFETVNKLRKIAWVTGYHNDNPFSAIADKRHHHRYKHFIKSLPAYNSFHAYRDNNIKDYMAHGISRVKILESFYIPEIDLGNQITDTGLGADVLFAGHPEDDGRETYIEHLIESGIQMKVYGDGKYWKKILSGKAMNQLGNIRVLDKEEYRSAIKYSKICLSFFSRWNRDDYTRRVFEIPAMGKMLMTTRTDKMQTLYKEAVEAEYFSSPEELTSKSIHYLENDTQREQIAINGHQRCIHSGYDIHSKMKIWVNDIINWQNNKS